jgi:hypothetical protein
MRRHGEWIPFSDTKYLRKLTLYDDLEWGIDLTAAAHVAVSPFGGPIACVAANRPSTIDVYNANGRPLFEACLPSDCGRVEALGWSAEEVLVVHSSKPACLLWNAAQEAFQVLKLTPGDRVLSAVKACGCFAVTASAQGLLLDAVQLEERRAPVSMTIPLEAHMAAPACMDVLAGKLTEAEDTIAFVAACERPPEGSRAAARGAAGRSTVFAVNLTSCSVTNLELHEAPVARLAVSPAGDHVAMVLENSTVVVVTSDFAAVVHTVGLGARVPPQRLFWCGAEYLALEFAQAQFSGDAYDTSTMSVVLHALEPTETKCEKFAWDLDGSGVVACVTEVDGLRVVTENSNYLIEVVLPCLVDIFRHGSAATSYRLCRACLDSDAGDVRGVTAIREIAGDGGALSDVLDLVLLAAVNEYDPAAQEQLLDIVAASKTHVSGIRYDSEVFVDCCRRLRMLNYVRDAMNSAVPVSLRQYQALSGFSDNRTLDAREAQVLVDRLIHRREYQMAYNVCAFLKIKVDKVLVQWSVAKVASRQGDAAVYAEIVQVMGTSDNAGFTAAALAAADCEPPRTELALQLLNAEPRAHNQVLLMVQMGHDDLAAEKAVASMDTDLVFLVLLKHAKAAGGAGEAGKQALFSLLARHSGAQQLFLSVAARAAPSLRPAAERYLEDEQYDRHAGMLRLFRCFQSAELRDGDRPAFDVLNGQRVPLVARSTAIRGTRAVDGLDASDMLDAFERAGEDGAAEAAAAAQHRDLLELQDAIADETGDSAVVNQSVMGTIRHCFLGDLADRAEALRVQFLVPEKKFWHAKLAALCAAGMWDAVERLGATGRYASGSAKSPIGWLPFIEELLKHKQEARAAKFVPRLREITDRVEWFVKLDEFQMAIDDAYDGRVPELIQQIRKRAQNPSIIQYADKKLAALR